jgi:cobalt/nickel transport protein
MSGKTLLLVAAVVALTALPLLWHRETRAGLEPFAGADGEAQELIEGLHPTYKPWFKPFFTPPSKEIESMLFSLQAALGAGFLGYYFGLRKGRGSGGRRP